MEHPDDKYLLVINGKPQGPYTTDELRSLGIKPGDFVRTAGMDDYKEAHEVAQLRALFNFARPQTDPQYYADFDQRLLASALDWFMILGMVIIVAFICILFISDEQTRIITGLALLAAMPVVNLIYHIAMESSPKQATYGKQILKIKVCDLHGEPIGLGLATGRNLAKMLSTLVLFMGYLLSFFNRKQQCLHDMIAGTLVVKERLI